MHSLFSGLLAAIPLVAAVIDDSAFSKCNTITKDIVILGGGSGGSYSAVRLREDYGQDILVVEKTGRLGGHTQTYTDPESGIPYDFGVQSFVDYYGARLYFERFDINITDYISPAPSRINTLVDFTTGKLVEGYEAPDSDAQTAALKKYVEINRQLAGFWSGGYWNFFPPGGTPEDLTLPFGEFVERYDLQAAVPLIYRVTGLGFSDLLAATTLFVMQIFTGPLGGVFIGEGGMFVPASGNNSEIYGKATELLGKDVMFNSEVVEAERSSKGVKLVVENKKGKQFLVKAKRLLVAFAPTLDNTTPLGLDEQEEAVFSQWSYSTNYASVGRHPSLVSNISYSNTNLDSVPDNYMEFPDTPSTIRFDHMGDDLYRILTIGGPEFLADDAKENANMCLKRMIEEGTIPEPEEDQDLELVAFGDHGATGLTVTGEQLTAGFITDLYALMGHEGTWYTGAAWGGYLSTDIWDLCEVVIPRMMDDLNSMEEEE